MLRPLTCVIGFLSRRLQGKSSDALTRFEDSFERRASNNEISEYDGVLLVRLGRGSAMQVRLGADRMRVSLRVVPIAKATQVYGESGWQMASDTQLQEWLQANSAIGAWLLTNGLTFAGGSGKKFSEQLA